MINPYVSKRGDVIWITLNPRVGHEQAGRWPALVLSPEPYNRKVGLALACPITNQIKGYPFEVLLLEGLPISGVGLADQVKSLDWRSRAKEFICTLPVRTVVEVLEKLSALLSMEASN